MHKRNGLKIISLILMICFNLISFPLAITYAASVNIADNQNAIRLWMHIKEQGGTDWWAAAAIGNSYAENRLSTDLYNTDAYAGAFQIQRGKVQEFLNWCESNQRDPSDIISQYDYLMSLYRNTCAKPIVGLEPYEMAVDTTHIYDAYSAAAYFCLGMEGAVCWSGISYGSGEILDSFHDEEHLCGSYTFTTGPYGTVCLQALQARARYTQIAYDSFSTGNYTMIIEETYEIPETFTFVGNSLTEAHLVEETPESLITDDALFPVIGDFNAEHITEIPQIQTKTRSADLTIWQRFVLFFKSIVKKINE